VGPNPIAFPDELWKNGSPSNDSKKRRQLLYDLGVVFSLASPTGEKTTREAELLGVSEMRAGAERD
jgi:hypothetical protein